MLFMLFDFSAEWSITRSICGLWRKLQGSPWAVGRDCFWQRCHSIDRKSAGKYSFLWLCFCCWTRCNNRCHTVLNMLYLESHFPCLTVLYVFMPGLWHCSLGDKKSIWLVKSPVLSVPRSSLSGTGTNLVWLWKNCSVKWKLCVLATAKLLVLICFIIMFNGHLLPIKYANMVNCQNLCFTFTDDIDTVNSSFATTVVCFVTSRHYVAMPECMNAICCCLCIVKWLLMPVIQHDMLHPRCVYISVYISVRIIMIF